MTETKRTVRVRTPGASDNGPGLGHVGAFAVVCFALGVLWPTLAGLELVPDVPGKKKADTSHEKARPKPEKPANPGEPPQAVPVSKGVSGPLELSSGARVDVEKSLVVNCRDSQDRRLPSCDTPGFDAVATDRLKALATCPDAESASGVLSIGFELDFEKQKILRFLRGKSTTLSDELADKLVDCAKREFLSATLKDVSFTHPKYLQFYVLRFVPAGTPVDAAEGSSPIIKASGTASIIWNSARIRSAASDGEVKARLLYGTKVFVTGRQGDWYRIRYDARGTEGWVHKNALAL